jgi:hypothetical protein
MNLRYLVNLFFYNRFAINLAICSEFAISKHIPIKFSVPDSMQYIILVRSIYTTLSYILS